MTYDPTTPRRRGCRGRRDSPDRPVMNGRNDCRAAAPHPVLVVDADPALRGLLEEWMGECGCELTYAGTDGERPSGRFDLLVVDIAFPRQGGPELLRRLSEEHPGTPIVALSPTFFGSVACAGALARTLGAARVLSKPVSREALISAACQLLPRA
jgi:CheY-like chemotaxis protein